MTTPTGPPDIAQSLPAATPVTNPHGRAGRNLAQAIGVGVGLAAMILLSTVPRQGLLRRHHRRRDGSWASGNWREALAVKQIIVPIVPVAVGADRA
jgi:hypothetical protein